MEKHTDKQFSEELQILKADILKMGGVVEEMIRDVMEAHQERDSDLAEKVMGRDKEVDKLEMSIDALCLKLLALWHPAASDLRFVTIGLRIATDLERMGDLAENIARQVKDLNKEPAIKMKLSLTDLAQKSKKMVKEALDSFVSQDTDKAEQVCESDDEVDQLNWGIQEELIEIIRKDSKTVAPALLTIQIARHLERLADHATNIAEEVIFMVKGKDIRHRGSR